MSYLHTRKYRARCPNRRRAGNSRVVALISAFIAIPAPTVLITTKSFGSSRFSLWHDVETTALVGSPRSIAKSNRCGERSFGAGCRKNKVLFVASNVLDIGDKEQHDARKKLRGYAPPSHILVMLGYEIAFVSPQGGTVEFMMDPLGISSYAIKYETFLLKAEKTQKRSEADLARCQAVYAGGGCITLFDVVSSEERMRIIGDIDEEGGVVGGCGHEPGGFANDVVVDQGIVATMFLPSVARLAEEMMRLPER